MNKNVYDTIMKLRKGLPQSQFFRKPTRLQRLAHFFKTPFRKSPMAKKIESIETIDQLDTKINSIRSTLEPHFRQDTAYKGMKGRTPSSGHCSIVALINYYMIPGAGMRSTGMQKDSHWFNSFDPLDFEFDITGDQFGKPPVMADPLGSIWPNAVPRDVSEVDEDTVLRAITLASRAGLVSAVSSLNKLLKIRVTE